MKAGIGAQGVAVIAVGIARRDQQGAVADHLDQLVLGAVVLDGLLGLPQLLFELVDADLQVGGSTAGATDLARQLLVDVGVGEGVGDACRFARPLGGEGDLENARSAALADAEIFLEILERHPARLCGGIRDLKLDDLRGEAGGDQEVGRDEIEELGEGLQGRGQGRAAALRLGELQLHAAVEAEPADDRVGDVGGSGDAQLGLERCRVGIDQAAGLGVEAEGAGVGWIDDDLGGGRVEHGPRQPDHGRDAGADNGGRCDQPEAALEEEPKPGDVDTAIVVVLRSTRISSRINPRVGRRSWQFAF